MLVLDRDENRKKRWINIINFYKSIYPDLPDNIILAFVKKIENLSLEHTKGNLFGSTILVNDKVKNYVVQILTESEDWYRYEANIIRTLFHEFQHILDWEKYKVINTEANRVDFSLYNDFQFFYCYSEYNACLNGIVHTKIITDFCGFDWSQITKYEVNEYKKELLRYINGDQTINCLLELKSFSHLIGSCVGLMSMGFNFKEIANLDQVLLDYINFLSEIDDIEDFVNHQETFWRIYDNILEKYSNPSLSSSQISNTASDDDIKVINEAREEYANGETISHNDID